MNRRLLATVSKSQSSPRILAGVILKRNPIVLRDPTSFEKAYADYRREFTQETSAPYNSDYFEAELRNGPSKSSKSKSSSSASTAVGEESKVKYMERDGDDTDQSRLDRLMSRSLYLTVREGVAGKWVFPCSPVEGEESLVEVCASDLCGLVKFNGDIYLNFGTRPLDEVYGSSLGRKWVFGLSVMHLWDTMEVRMRKLVAIRFVSSVIIRIQ